jgi:hypothetical protein
MVSVSQLNMGKTRDIFVMEHAGMPFQKFFLRRTQTRMAFRNRSFPDIGITNTLPL